VSPQQPPFNQRSFDGPKQQKFSGRAPLPAQQQSFPSSGASMSQQAEQQVVDAEPTLIDSPPEYGLSIDEGDESK
jgi:hypothetical protein